MGSDNLASFCALKGYKKKDKKDIMVRAGFEPTPLSRPENSLKQWKN